MKGLRASAGGGGGVQRPWVPGFGASHVGSKQSLHFPVVDKYVINLGDGSACRINSEKERGENWEGRQGPDRRGRGHSEAIRLASSGPESCRLPKKGLWATSALFSDDLTV